MKKQAVADTSSLIFLSKLDIFDLAKNMLSEIFVPTQVLNELIIKGTPEVNIIKKNLDSILKEVRIMNVKELPLGSGEKAAISFCLQNNIETFLSDDKKARRFARSFGLDTIGVLGILLWNLEHKKLEKAEFITLFNQLVRNGYYLSPSLYSKIMEIIG